MKKGMVVSNEPGYYEDGNYGIRIENLLEVQFVDPADDVGEDEEPPEKPTGQKTFLKFAKLTMIPIQKNLIDTKLMTDAELDWLDAYHEEVMEKVAPLLEEGSEAMAYRSGAARAAIHREAHRHAEAYAIRATVALLCVSGASVRKARMPARSQRARAWRFGSGRPSRLLA